MKIQYPKTFASNINNIRVGIDLSKNCTGLVILDGDTNNILLLSTVIPSTKVKQKTKRKINETNNDKNIIKEFVYFCNDTKYDDYSKNELVKTQNFKNLCNCVINEVMKVIIDLDNISNIYFRIEGVILDSNKQSAWTLDYSQLAGIFKSMLLDITTIDNIKIVAPMSLKQHFTGVGSDSKELTTKLFLFYIINKYNIGEKDKIDDVADAYALAYEYIDKEDFYNKTHIFLEDFVRTIKVNKKLKTIEEVGDFFDNFLK